MEIGNGTTEKNTGRGYNYLFSENEQEALGQPGCDSRDNRYTQQGGFAENDSEWRDSIRTSIVNRDTPSGKIFQRLDQLESTHYKYVHAHQTRLQARLDESKQLEEQFRQEAAELRQQILDLATTDESTDGNGHKS